MLAAAICISAWIAAVVSDRQLGAAARFDQAICTSSAANPAGVEAAAVPIVQ